MNQQVSEQPLNEGDEGINIGQVIDFFSAEWKRLAAGAVVGVALGAGGWAGCQGRHRLQAAGDRQGRGAAALLDHLPLMAPLVHHLPLRIFTFTSLEPCSTWRACC